jgi:ATP-binding cassette subfamily B protein
VKKGEFAALIGSSGIGKSTIMKLLLSVYQPNEGEIQVKLQDKTIGLQELPKGMFAYVPQGNYLMSGPIWKVVGFAEKSDTIDRAKVEEACKVACAHEFITELPNGYDTVLGERGDGLSEGQMQRIAVARAVYSGCPILLLDEATSALDADTERRMISALKEMSDYTVFLVTHRKDVWELCDRVLERKE